MVDTEKLARWIAGLTQADAGLLRQSLEMAAANSSLLLAVDAAEPTLLRRLGREPTDLPAEVRLAVEWLALLLNCLADGRR